MNHSLHHNVDAASNPASEPNPRQPSGTALVLGGGGAAGNAWLIGVIAGLFEAGLDVTTADLIIGTSAGATAAAQITAASPAQLFSSILDETVRPSTPPALAGPRPNIQREGLARVTQISAASENAADMRRRMGAAAIELDAVSNGSDRWRAIVAARLPGPTWPQQKILMTAVDAETGEDASLDRDSGVDLVDAVAASTAGGPAYRIGEKKYIDGGYRRNENADLAIGYERVLVLSPLGGRTLHPLEWRMQLSAQVEDLEASGSRVHTILPDDAALAAFGDNMMNLAARPDAAKAGHAQGAALAAELSRFWSGAPSNSEDRT
ncbi:MAG: patatin-like phospholipase family protein [Cryobacterium sp.]|nr:patatin-like phospholipase family protein [Cryobacterium sp.]